jgi:hypothetical protein
MKTTRSPLCSALFLCSKSRQKRPFRRGAVSCASDNLGGARESVAAHSLYRLTRERHGVICPVNGCPQGQRKGCRCDPHLGSSESEPGYTEFPARGDIPPIQTGADGKTERSVHGDKPSPRGKSFASSHRQRASHAIAPTGQGTLVKAPLLRPLGRQDQWVRVTAL